LNSAAVSVSVPPDGLGGGVWANAYELWHLKQIGYSRGDEGATV
jgi:hypothetical protein